MENEVLIGKIVELIKKKSRERGLSIHKMLLSAKLSAHLIDDWKSGRAEPSLSALQAIGEVLGLSLTDFFSDAPALTEAQENILSGWRLLSGAEKNALALYIEAMNSRHEF